MKDAFKKVLRFALVIIAAFIVLGVLNGKGDITKLWSKGNEPALAVQSQNTTGASQVKGDSATAAPQKEISLPPPLKVDQKYIGDESLISLTADGVIADTNKEREAENLPDLKANAELDASAQTKLDDMFRQQYFDHVSPEGASVSDLGEQAGYDYILIGENLALGDFKDDQSLVDAWMASPKHRANILNDRYTDIGVAVGRGMYKGVMTWMAVTHFGRPLSLCPEIDKNLKSTIDQNQTQINELSAELNLQQGGEAAALLAYTINFKKVQEYNNLVSETSADITQYNNEVAAFNVCIKN